MNWLDLVLAACAVPVLGASAYLLALALMARRVPAPATGAADIHFDVIVPAHNEEGEIAATVRSLRSVDYPPHLYRVLVVADNCTDGTAAAARAAGADVLVRHDRERRGKGYALAYAFSRSLADGVARAIVVVDADTLVSKNLLAAFAVRFGHGASVVQADYGVRNPESSWRTRLMTIALAAFHGVRSTARERLGLSCGLRGNGMGFSRTVIERHPPGAFSIVEDLEYGLQLGYAGVRVEYVDEATVLGYMAVSDGAARTQRRRWERGRQALVRQHVPQLIARACRTRDARLLDLALDLLVPPLGQLSMVIAVGLAISGIAGLPVATALWGAALAGIVVYVLRGWALSGVGIAGLADLMWAPVYVAWKLMLRVRDKGREPKEWERTIREARP
jgi:cellulose synthase/poly-beta-1,6-N-acetylglucosamine synthase-like glycosyltransferase